MELIIICVIAGIIGGAVASGKGRSELGWGCLCVLFPFCVIIILFLPSKKEKAPAQTIVQVVYAAGPPPAGGMTVNPPTIDQKMIRN